MYPPPRLGGSMSLSHTKQVGATRRRDDQSGALSLTDALPTETSAGGLALWPSPIPHAYCGLGSSSRPSLLPKYTPLPSLPPRSLRPNMPSSSPSSSSASAMHVGCCTFAIRSPFADRAHDTEPVALHIPGFALQGAAPLHAVWNCPSQATVAVPEDCFPSAAVNVPLTATGAHPVHMRPTRPP